MAVNNLDFDVRFWNLGPGWQLYPTQPLSLDLYRQKYAKIPIRFRFFKSYDRLNQQIYEHSRFFYLHQNRTTGTDFVSLPALQPGFMAHFRIFLITKLVKSVITSTNSKVLPSKSRRHPSWFVVSKQCRNWPHFAMNHPFNIATELNFFQSQNINSPCLEA